LAEAQHGAVVQAEIEHGVHHAGIEARAPERTETSNGLLASPNPAPTVFSTGSQRLLDLVLQLAG
jgi:hypothetical protein